LCVLNRQPTWAKITQTVNGKGKRAESKDQRGTATDVLCVLTDTNGHTRTSCVTSMLSPRTSVLICVLMESHERPVCADGHTQTHTDSHKRPVCAGGQPRTATDILCVLTDTHRRPMYTEQTAHVGQNHPNYSPRGPKSPEQSSGRSSMLSPTTKVLICVLMDSHRRPVCADGH
ncbi:unnamed protein product, partial [Brassica rapa]